MTRRTILEHINQRYDQLGLFVARPHARDELRGVRHPVRKYIIECALAAGLSEFFQSKYFCTPDARVIGGGAQAIVTTSDERTVKKYHYRTVGASEAELQNAVEQYTAKQTLLIDHLGSLAVQQTYTIEELPGRPTMNVVVATQPFVAVKRYVELVHHSSRRSSTDIIQLPGMASFLTCNMALLCNEEPAVSDIYGRQNLCLTTDDQLCLIDPIPLLSTDAADAKGFKASQQAIEAHLKLVA